MEGIKFAAILVSTVLLLVTGCAGWTTERSSTLHHTTSSLTEGSTTPAMNVSTLQYTTSSLTEATTTPATNGTGDCLVVNKTYQAGQLTDIDNCWNIAPINSPYCSGQSVSTSWWPVGKPGSVFDCKCCLPSNWDEKTALFRCPNTTLIEREYKQIEQCSWQQCQHVSWTGKK